MSDPALKTILFLAANPKGTTPLRLDQEMRDIAEGLQRSHHREQFHLEQRWATRPRDIQRALLDCQPYICQHSDRRNGKSSSSNLTIFQLLFQTGVLIADENIRESEVRF